MILRIHRDVPGDETVLGVLTVDHEDGKGPLDFGFTCEDQDRGLKQSMSEDEIAAVKVSAETAIPTGEYRVLFTYSPKYAETMKKYGRTDGKMPEVLNVPGFRGIRIHSGNDESHTAGCVLPGLRRDVAAMTVSRSRPACKWLYSEIAKCEAAGTPVLLIITNEGR